MEIHAYKPEYDGNKSGYSLLTDSEKSNINFFMRGQMLPTTFDSTHFYAVTPQQLLKYISQFDSCLLYF
ncbi:MAG: hypothetical protein LBR36_03030, partial [Bacteroidales bacterium]|nr:hypothetical protein [Bacteroidales bacterium]